MAYYFLIFFSIIFSNNTDFVGIIFSPHMTLKVIFYKVKGSILKSFYSSQHDILLLVFLSAVVSINKNFLYYLTKAFQQHHLKQTKFRLSKRLNNHPHGYLWILIKYLYLQENADYFAEYTCFEIKKAITARISVQVRVFSARNFPVVKSGKIRTYKSPYSDTFHVVNWFIKISSIFQIC